MRYTITSINSKELVASLVEDGWGLKKKIPKNDHTQPCCTRIVTHLESLAESTTPQKIYGVIVVL